MYVRIKDVVDAMKSHKMIVRYLESEYGCTLR